jgi:DNA-3-methyladenine glycosylase II
MTSPAYVPPDADRILAARRQLAALDPALARADAVTPVFEWRSRPGGFAALAQLIVEQQVSVASARAIWARVEAGLGGLTPAAVAGAEEGALKGFGLSAPKVRYLRALAEATLAEEMDFAGLAALDDEAASTALRKMTGVGRWTAETYLLFCEGRLDFLPAGDVALQQALAYADGALVRPNEAMLYARAEAWRPYRGVAAHLLWRYYGGVKRGEIER